MQILNCNSVLGNCCNDPGIAIMIDTIRRVFGLIQLVVPILLIVWSGFQLMKMVMDPDQKGGTKSIINKFIAAAIVFFIPSLLNVVLGMIPQSFQVASCWKAASNKSETLKSRTATYIPIEKSKKHKLPNPSGYEKGIKKEAYSPSGTTSGSTATEPGNATEAAIVAYAKQFVGKPYKYGGNWNGNLPYTPTDCVGFVQGVYKHFGINIHANTDIWPNSSKFTDVTNAPHHPGDIVVYRGHWALMTGNGTEIVHAMNPKLGIGVSKDYRKCGKPLWKIFRVNAVSR